VVAACSLQVGSRRGRWFVLQHDSRQGERNKWLPAAVSLARSVAQTKQQGRAARAPVHAHTHFIFGPARKPYGPSSSPIKARKATGCLPDQAVQLYMGLDLYSKPNREILRPWLAWSVRRRTGLSNHKSNRSRISAFFAPPLFPISFVSF
jgi:hypothetical protein